MNDHWQSEALHLCAYVMWRLNWIHPFTDGNGRTSRAISYVVLCCRIGDRLPGRQTIPEAISNNKTPYYEALEAADEAFTKGPVDVSKLQELLKTYLAQQLKSVFEDALAEGGNNFSDRKFH
ncbi:MULTISPECIES: Fic family protein [unclassified Iodidimonas]|uniref:Fic family protein n=1 Tax=unclassified Iodidimonas TaxID=2626145 RepID=UPI002482E69F|nr:MULTISPECIES: Fic family protein [unclassified Iodidimonas]